MIWMAFLQLWNCSHGLGPSKMMRPAIISEINPLPTTIHPRILQLMTTALIHYSIKIPQALTETRDFEI